MHNLQDSATFTIMYYTVTKYSDQNICVTVIIGFTCMLETVVQSVLHTKGNLGNAFWNIFLSHIMVRTDVNSVTGKQLGGATSSKPHPPSKGIAP